MLGLGNSVTSPSVSSGETFTFQMTPKSMTADNLITEYEIGIRATFTRPPANTTTAQTRTAEVIAGDLDISGVSLAALPRLNGTVSITVTRNATDYTATGYLYASANEINGTINAHISPLAQSSINAAAPNNEHKWGASDFTPNLPDLTDGQIYMSLDTYSLVLNAVDPDPVVNGNTYDATDSASTSIVVSIAS